MKLFPVVAEYFKMDGGACFGVVPKSLWSKQIEADERNMVPIASRCLLADTGDRLILVDAGMGNKQSEKFFSHYYAFGGQSLEAGFERLGYRFDQVTDVIITHLHFDHVGGVLRYAPDGKTPELVFPNANHYVTRAQWEWALNPNPREKASYFPENFLPLYESGHLEFITEEGNLFPGLDLMIRNGHSRGQLLPVFDYQGHKLLFTADFIASVLNIPLSWVPSFDIEPLVSMQEKEAFYQKALRDDYVLFFQHDFQNECCRLETTPKGVRAKEVFTLDSL